MNLFSALSPWLQASLGLILLADLILLSAERQRSGIRILCLQGVLLGFMPLMLDGQLAWPMVLLTIIFLATKAVALPYMLARAHDALPPSPPLPPYLGHARCVLAGLAGFAFSLWLATHLPPPRNPLFLPFFAPAVATILAGLLVIITRRKALTQVMGYLVMENGIYLLGVPLAHHDAMWLEISILLDIFAGIFIMVLAIQHLNKAFDTIDFEQIASLQD